MYVSLFCFSCFLFFHLFCISSLIMCHLASILLFFSHIYLSDAIFISFFNHFVVFVSIYCTFMLSLSYLFSFSHINNELQILSDSSAASAVGCSNSVDNLLLQQLQQLSQNFLSQHHQNLSRREHNESPSLLLQQATSEVASVTFSTSPISSIFLFSIFIYILYVLTLYTFS